MINVYLLLDRKIEWLPVIARIFESSGKDYGVNYNKFMNWLLHLLWNKKLGKIVHVNNQKLLNPDNLLPSNRPSEKMEIKQLEVEQPISWVMLQLPSGATQILKNTSVLDRSLLLNKMILKHLFECILNDKDCDKKTFLPCFYKQ